jgi:hypothetical protein
MILLFCQLLDMPHLSGGWIILVLWKLPPGAAEVNIKLIILYYQQAGEVPTNLMHHSTCQLWQSRSLIYCLHRQVIFA